MNFSLIILLVILSLFLLGFIYIEPILMKHKVKNDNEYGSARFSTDNEIKKNFKKEKVSNIKEAGFPVSFSKDLKTIYFDRETPHYVYLGSTGSGKSVTAVIPTCTFISSAKKKRVFLSQIQKVKYIMQLQKCFKIEDIRFSLLILDIQNYQTRLIY